MKRYYIVETGWKHINTKFKQVIVQEPNPENPKILREKCVWCNETRGDPCPDCKQWYDDIFDVNTKRKNVKVTETSKKDLFLEML